MKYAVQFMMQTALLSLMMGAGLAQAAETVQPQMKKFTVYCDKDGQSNAILEINAKVVFNGKSRQACNNKGEVVSSAVNNRAMISGDNNNGISLLQENNRIFDQMVNQTLDQMNGA